MRSSWTFSRKLALGFAVIVVAFAIVAVTGLEATRSLAADAALVAHTHEVRTQLGTLLAGLTEAGASQTFQTSSQLTSLSTSLTRLVQAT